MILLHILMPGLHEYLLRQMPRYIYWSTYDNDDICIANPENEEDMKYFYNDAETVNCWEHLDDRHYYTNYGSHHGYIHFMGDWSLDRVKDIMSKLMDDFKVDNT